VAAQAREVVRKFMRFMGFGRNALTSIYDSGVGSGSVGLTKFA
jgi:hypothetical protein